MIANFNYGNFDITLCNKYIATNYKDSVLMAGVQDDKYQTIYIREDDDDLDDVLENMYVKNKIKVKSGTKVGMFNVADNGEYDDNAYGGYRLDGEVEFTSNSRIYHDSTNKDCSGEVSVAIVMLGDDKYIGFHGEYSIITKENSEDELNKFNKAIGKEFNIIILTNS
jgi:hypothetical protein